MLRVNGMTTRRRRDRRVPVSGRLVRQARRCSSRWRTRPSCGSSATTSTTWRSVRWRPALEKGVVDAIYTQSKPFQHLQEATGKFKAIEDLSRYPGLDPAGRQHPGRHHLHRRDGRGAPRARRHVHEGHDQGRALGQRAQARRRRDPRQADLLPATSRTPTRASSTSTWCPTCRRRTWPPSRSARTSCSATATSRTTSTCTSGPRRSSSRRREEELLKEEWAKRSSAKLPEGDGAAGVDARGSDSRSESRRRRRTTAREGAGVTPGSLVWKR